MRLPTSLLLFGALLVVVGCGSSHLKVEGTVTFDGQPVQEGSISFEPKDGQGRDFGAKIEGGHYSINSPPGVAAGEMVVRIRAFRKTGKKIPAGPPHPPDTMIDEIVQAPPRYNTKSNLAANLAAGQVNRFDFKLESGKR